jgi:hypothetical protein
MKRLGLNSLRKFLGFACAIAMAALMARAAYGQQEVDPTWFDPYAAVAPNKPTAQAAQPQTAGKTKAKLTSQLASAARPLKKARQNSLEPSRPQASSGDQTSQGNRSHTINRRARQ